MCQKKEKWCNLVKTASKEMINESPLNSKTLFSVYLSFFQIFPFLIAPHLSRDENQKQNLRRMVITFELILCQKCHPIQPHTGDLKWHHMWRVLSYVSAHLLIAAVLGICSGELVISVTWVRNSKETLGCSFGDFRYERVRHLRCVSLRETCRK